MNTLTKTLKEACRTEFIEGIYHYCDRWCERCSVISCCLLYSLDQEDCSEDDNLVEQLTSNLQTAKDLLRLLCAQAGIDEGDSESQGTMEEGLREPGNHHLAKASGRYAIEAANWFASNRNQFDGLDTTVFEFVESQEVTEIPGKQREPLRESLETISWYQYFIKVKLMRALQSRERESVQGFETALGWPDSDGSAKVALIGMDRSVKAWESISQFFSASDPSIASILLQLLRLRKRAEKEFPGARNYRRP